MAPAASGGGRAPALAVRDPCDPRARIASVILLQWTHDRLVPIRDFRYAPYVADNAQIIIATAP